MRGAAFGILFLIGVCLVAMIAEVALGAPPDLAGDPIERAASDPDSSVRICTCIEGPLADEIERLRAQVRMLRAASRVNRDMECAKRRRSTQAKK